MRAMRLRRRRDLGLSLTDDGAVVVRAQAAGVGAKVPPLAIGVLAAFSRARDPAEVAAGFGPGGPALVQGLAEAGLLVPEEQADETPVFFDNFADLDVHRRMLADRSRVAAYRRAIEALVRPGDAVIDAGTGTGLLAGLAARAGAGRVVAVDNSALLDEARKVLADSGLHDVVRCVKSDFAALVLEEQVDLIVTETFGALALAEGAAADLTRCVQANLKPGGVVVPSAVSLHVAPVVDPRGVEALRAPWDVVGLDLSRLAAAQALRGVTLPVDPTTLGPVVDLVTVAFPHDAVRARGVVRFPALDHVHGLAAWFTLHLAPGVDLPTGPTDPPTHWQQVLLPFDLACGGQDLEVELRIEPADEDRRGLRVSARWAVSGRSGTRAWRVR